MNTTDPFAHIPDGVYESAQWERLTLASNTAEDLSEFYRRGTLSREEFLNIKFILMCSVTDAKAMTPLLKLLHIVEMAVFKS